MVWSPVRLCFLPTSRDASSLSTPDGKGGAGRPGTRQGQSAAAHGRGAGILSPRGGAPAPGKILVSRRFTGRAAPSRSYGKRQERGVPTGCTVPLKGSTDNPRRKVKVDRLILANCRVHLVGTIYCDDRKMKALAEQIGIKAVHSWELSMPPAPPQRELPFNGDYIQRIS